MKCAIYGAGSLGTILGAYLTKNGFPIELVNRNVKHVEALQKNGAHIGGTSHRRHGRFHDACQCDTSGSDAGTV